MLAERGEVARVAEQGAREMGAVVAAVAVVVVVTALAVSDTAGGEVMARVKEQDSVESVVPG